MAHGPLPARHAEHPDLSVREYALLAPVLAAIIALGIYPNLLLDRINPTATRIVDGMGVAQAVQAARASGQDAVEEGS